MNLLAEFRLPEAVCQTAELIRRSLTKPWIIMEVCGGQTHAIVKHGLDRIMPPELSLVHGPGCPVCVTPLELIDRALELAARPEVIFCSFGDMLRVPGSARDLLQVRAAGGDVRIVYSPLDAVNIARQNPTREVVFFAVGFETTAPANALAVKTAQREKLQNFSLLTAQVRVPPALEAILSDPQCCVQGFLAAGHVCTVMGWEEYIPIAEKYKVPIVVTGFEPLDIMQGAALIVRQLEAGSCRVENQYQRAVRRQGNTTAKALIKEVFQAVNRKWRGIGLIPRSGLDLAPEFALYDAELKFNTGLKEVSESALCIAGEVLRGIKKPEQCPAFGNPCNPLKPLGAPMVSAEGACAAYYRYRRKV